MQTKPYTYTVLMHVHIMYLNKHRTEVNKNDMGKLVSLPSLTDNDEAENLT